MSIALRIFDESPGAARRPARELRLVSERITLRELLRRRIEAEAAEINAGRSGVHPLVTPTEQEMLLNGAPRRFKLVDPEQQARTATEAFEHNRMVVIVGERQIEDLDAPLILAPDTEVTFLRLVPLVGG